MTALNSPLMVFEGRFVNLYSGNSTVKQIPVHSGWGGRGPSGSRAPKSQVWSQPHPSWRWLFSTWRSWSALPPMLLPHELSLSALFLPGLLDNLVQNSSLALPPLLSPSNSLAFSPLVQPSLLTYSFQLVLSSSMALLPPLAPPLLLASPNSLAPPHPMDPTEWVARSSDHSAPPWASDPRTPPQSFDLLWPLTPLAPSWPVIPPAQPWSFILPSPPRFDVTLILLQTSGHEAVVPPPLQFHHHFGPLGPPWFSQPSAPAWYSDLLAPVYQFLLLCLWFASPMFLLSWSLCLVIST